MIRRMSLLITCITASLAPGVSLSEELSPRDQKALEKIEATANDMCQASPLDSSSQAVELTAAAKASVDSAITRLVRLGVDGAVKYESLRSAGMLKQDLANAIKSGSDCTQSVVATFTRAIYPYRKTEDSNAK